jgi:16S rRNA (uracil1498-N3)-methyltransferase
MRVFYAPDVHPLHQLDEDESKHMVRVLRARPGDEFEVVNGKGKRWRGVLVDADKRACTLRTELIEEVDAPASNLTLVVAPTKSTDRFEWLLEKAMEYGVSCIQPVWTHRSERKSAKSDRWNRILISALKQSRQIWLTQLNEPMDWSAWLEAPKDKSGFIAHCEPAEKLHFFDSVQGKPSCWIAIGPEGDFTPEEIQAATAKGAQAVSLGNQRLRTETAALAAIQMHALAHR